MNGRYRPPSSGGMSMKRTSPAAGGKSSIWILRGCRSSPLTTRRSASSASTRSTMGRSERVLPCRRQREAIGAGIDHGVEAKLATRFEEASDCDGDDDATDRRLAPADDERHAATMQDPESGIRRSDGFEIEMRNPEEPVVHDVDGDSRLLEGHVADQRLVAPAFQFHLHEEDLTRDHVESLDANRDRPADLATQDPTVRSHALHRA